MRRVLILASLVAFGLSAEIWVNAIRDPGAELGQGDWETDIWESKEGAADSCRVDAHDTSRAYKGKYSFLTDTDKDSGVEGNAEAWVWCYQYLRVPKAVQDLDSCFWRIFLGKGDADRLQIFYICFRSETKQVYWYGDVGNISPTDSTFPIKFPLPDSGVWEEYSYDFNNTWTSVIGWSALDTIEEIHLFSAGWKGTFWRGQEVSWDNIVLQSIAYYDYAAESIDSDTEANEHYTPVATFANEGILNDKDGVVFAEVLDGETKVYIDSQSVSIPVESSEQVTFSEWTVPHDGSYTLRVYPILALDEFSGDDTLVMILTGEGIEEKKPQTELIRTSYDSKGVLFSFPFGTNGKLAIYDASGREIHSYDINPGIQEHLWSTLEVPSGLYFYNLKSSERISTGKLIIIH